MASQSNRNTLHLLVRILGLTGVVMAIVGLVLWTYYDDLMLMPSAEANAQSGLETPLGMLLTIVGASFAGIALLVEIFALFRVMFSRRGAVGGNVAIQALIATALLIAINYLSFRHYERFDWTTKQEFTLDPAIRAELAKLDKETVLVVLQVHAPVGLQRRLDNYDSAANSKTVEKVRDLVDQFREVGSKLKVYYLDIDDVNYANHMAELEKLSTNLGKQIKDATENSIFFYSKDAGDNSKGSARESIQRLSFADIYQLDREASENALDPLGEKRGNLVLKYQGAGPFARKILNIEEKHPRVAVAAVYESDTMESPPPWGMGGVKKALAARGFESRDIILKRGQFSVLTYEENRFERLEAQIADLDEDIDDLKALLKKIEPEKKDFVSAMVKITALKKDGQPVDEALKQINRTYGFARDVVPVRIGDQVVLRQRKVIAPRKKFAPDAPVKDLTVVEVKEHLDLIDEVEFELANAETRKNDLVRDQGKLNSEDLAEKRRITDLKAKMDRMLSDCDLLLIPRLTLVDVSKPGNYSYSTYKMDDAQAAAIKAFVKSGKPVLCCLSPPFDEKDADGDKFDQMLRELGVRLGSDSVFYRSDSEAIAESRADPEARGAHEPPPVDVNWAKGAGMLRSQVPYVSDRVNPLRTSIRLGARVSSTQPLDLRLRHPRPVYFVRHSPDAVATLVGFGGIGSAAGMVPLVAGLAQGPTRIDDRAFFLLSGADSWNEEKSFPIGNRIPRYRRTTDDPHKGTIREKRRGPFPVAIGVETSLPDSWFEGNKDAPRPKVRLAVIGHGGVFLGGTLSPAQEKLLLDTCNFLLGRDDLFARDKETWQFPRVGLDESDKRMWKLGTWLGLPLLFAYLGTMMLLVRRLR